jgi:hypothetical protein
LHDKLTLYAASVYSNNNLAPAATRVTANTNRGGARYDRDITPRLFAFVNADFATDALQDLNLRQVYGGGLGWHAIKNPNTMLDILGGIAYTRENYTQIAPLPRLIHSFVAGQLGDEFMHKIAKSTVITQRAYFFPDLQNSGEYRATFDFGTVTKINKWLGWQNTFGDVYVTNPPAGKKKNDVVFTTGLGTPTGNPIAPVIKITGNARTAQTMADNTDVDVSGVMNDTETFEQAAARLFEEVIEVASGRPTAAERLGHREFAIHRRNPTI